MNLPQANEVRCACGAPRRPGAYDCLECHKKSMRRYRKRRLEHQSLLERSIETLTINNRNTREKFEAQCRSPYVVVFADPEETVEDFAGRVVSFHPGDMVSVVDSAGKIHAVPLRKVKEDIGYKMYVECQQ